jgi:hypothetical protein
MEPLPTTSLDHLVELHVLAENGDATAAAEAARLIAADGEARRVWDTVESTCRRLRTEAPGLVTETREVSH